MSTSQINAPVRRAGNSVHTSLAPVLNVYLGGDLAVVWRR